MIPTRNTLSKNFKTFLLKSKILYKMKKKSHDFKSNKLEILEVLIFFISKKYNIWILLFSWYFS